MEDYAQLVSLLSALIALPQWDPDSVSRVIVTKLAPIEARTPKLRCYAADATGAIRRVELDHPVYGGAIGWTLHLRPAQLPPADPLVALAPILTKDALFQMTGPPTPGSAGPTAFRHSRVAHHAGTETVVGFIGTNFREPQTITAITLRRAHPNFAPDVYAQDRFRAVSIQQPSGTAYAIEHKEGNRAAVRVLDLKHEGRALRIVYVPDDPFLDEQFARGLIRNKLLDEHLEHRFHGKIDRLIFVNAELGATVEVPEKP